MLYKRIIIYSFVVFLIYCNSAVTADNFYVNNIYSTTPPRNQAHAAWDVISRIIPDKADKFRVVVSTNLGPVDRDTFIVYKNSSSDVVDIIGSTGVAATRGFYYYLTKYCKAHISWEGEQLELPEPLPDVNITVTSQDKFRYYQNVCTWSYSFTWWSWSQWRRHIDWMAISGINLALAPIQETLWVKVYRKLGLTEDEINEHIAGPAFLAWQRMGNLNGWGGPISETWLRKSHFLQQQIIIAMRALGIVTALPAFAGHVPQAFGRLFPNASLTLVPRWSNFRDNYTSVYFLESSDRLFRKVSSMFHREVTSEFGTDHVYFCDPYNENTPKSGDDYYIETVVSDIYASMRHNDHSAIWLLQSWMFVYDPFWTDSRMETFLTAVPIGRMLVLDLQAEQNPQYMRTMSFYGQPFIWCMLHNFGGTLGLFGSVGEVNDGIIAARKFEGSSMVGIGATPEGVNQNYVLYELTYEMGWTELELDLEAWFEDYSIRRYGIRNEFAVDAWDELRTSVYNYNGREKMRGKYTYNRRPSLNIQPWYWYNTSCVITAWSDLLEASAVMCESELFQHDLVDVTRQALQQIADQLYVSIITAYNKKKLVTLRLLSEDFLKLLDDLNRILSTNKDFLLGNWLEQAKSLAENDADRELYEFNARNQITLWGPHGEIVDYANKQWAGIVSDFFKPRWEIFLVNLEDAVYKNKPLNEKATKLKIFKEAEKPFTFRRNYFPVNPKGDPIAISTQLFQKWAPFSTSLTSLPIRRRKIF